MSGYRAVFGIDPHARTTTVCAAGAATGEAGAGTFRGNPYGEMAERAAGFPQPSHGACGAGCTGFVPAGELPAEGRRVVPMATSRIPTGHPDDTPAKDRPARRRAPGAAGPCGAGRRGAGARQADRGAARPLPHRRGRRREALLMFTKKWS